MALLPLNWKEGEGYDIHVLRGGPPSRSLMDAIEIPADVPNTTASLTFTPLFAGPPGTQSIAVDLFTGSVTASVPADPTRPKLNNFLVNVQFRDTLDPQARDFRAEYRVHVHDGIEKLWLTPTTLTAHMGADEMRFTVLALFTDGVVGDITDWESIQYISDTPSVIGFNSQGVLSAQATSGAASITARLQLSSPAVNLTSPPVRALAAPAWTDVAGGALFHFIAGPCAPNAADPSSSARDSVKTVVESATNILFVSEGFSGPLRGDFNNLVATMVEDLRSKSHLEPYPLLKGAINYWSVYLPSEENGITELGDHFYEGASFTASLVPHIAFGPSTATSWSLSQMLREVGFPILPEVDTPFLPSHVNRWQKFFGTHVTEDKTRAAYPAWINLALRTIINERSTAFGLAVSDRPRAHPATRLENSLRFDFRRTSEVSLRTFVEALKYGGHPVGQTWMSGAGDDGLVCFVCLSDRIGAQARYGNGYVAVSTGRRRFARLAKVTSGGWQAQVSPPIKHSRTLFASVVSHELSHALGLWDEYGDGRGTRLMVKPADLDDFPNVEAGNDITTLPSTGVVQFDKLQRLKWNWPRLTKAGVLTDLPRRSLNGYHLAVVTGHGTQFALGDVVRFREWPVAKRPADDPFTAFHRTSGLQFQVAARDTDSVSVVPLNAAGQPVDVDSPRPGQMDPRSWTEILHALFAPDVGHAVVVPLQASGADVGLVAPVILQHIRTSNGPLNAPDLQPAAVCVAARSSNSVMPPGNLPPLTRSPRTRADILGVYEGGSYHDCGIYRPAGRCKMRNTDTTIPFCHVCRYALVDRVSPPHHPVLDAGYERVYPQG
jgi:hypothetical protein